MGARKGPLLTPGVEEGPPINTAPTRQRSARTSAGKGEQCQSLGGGAARCGGVGDQDRPGTSRGVYASQPRCSSPTCGWRNTLLPCTDSRTSWRAQSCRNSSLRMLSVPTISWAHGCTGSACAPGRHVLRVGRCSESAATAARRKPR
ncbi:hypothetical protein C1I93_16055 [Micromonospora endophytica]|uniref:Uncharacterized protein n=1 Tax=Micromonospora endophytica TaxID=515350 RepID=A0A2W2D2P4_9ACTN|nr:hypothetical protein C1I93_16055 [Micromonospora endophytica]RIW47364.1 hypothetical protein D3H59_10125 [Micromonospora endophytica]